jgi:hypothetical protein
VDQSKLSLDKGGSATLDAFLGLAPSSKANVLVCQCANLLLLSIESELTPYLTNSSRFSQLSYLGRQKVKARLFDV